jgi:two-component system LytT family response regulator
MRTLRILLADDERPAREFLKKLLAEADAIELIGEAANGTEALALIRSLRPDLALLDLQMPGIGGIDVVRELSTGDLPLIAFITAYDDQAVRAFELNAVDYLLKPVERERLLHTVERARARLSGEHWREDESSRVKAAAEDVSSPDSALPIERVPVRLRDEIRLIPVGEIASIVANGELLQIFTSDAAKYVINYRLKDLEVRLDSSRFLRVSRGAVVNMDHVNSFTPLAGGAYAVNLANGQELVSSRQQSRILREKLLKL